MTPHFPVRSTAITGFVGTEGFMAAVGPILPALRAYGRRLTGNLADSEDLVQDTLVRAWTARERFQPGTNLKAWMIRIERNSFLSGLRHANRHVELDPELLDRRMIAMPSQEDRLHLADLDRAVEALPVAQQRAFAGASKGVSYGDLSERLGVSEGTLKSQISRARSSIVACLEPVDPAPKAAARPGSRSSRDQKTEPPRRNRAPTRYEAWKSSGGRMIG